MRIVGWTTKNRGAVDPSSSKAKPRKYGPRTNTKGKTHADETVMELLRRTMRGEAVPVVAAELGVPYTTAIHWHSGDQKFPLWRKVMEEIEAEQQEQKAPLRRG